MSESIQFSLLVPRRTVFGWGERRQLGGLAKSLGKRAFLIDGSKTLRRSPLWKEMLSSLEWADIQVESIATAGAEPTIEDVDQAAAIVQRLTPGPGDFVIGIGGGAALDLAKAVAAMATNGAGASVCEFLEGIGSGKELTIDPLPILAIPTTSGTGSEATKNAVISCTEPPCKKSLRSEKLMPSCVLIDPELTVSLSPDQTAYSGMDAITQLLESFFSKRSQVVTDQWCDLGLMFGMRSLPNAYHSPDDRLAREEMASAAFLSGMALANSGLGMAHGVAAALGAICDVPHGLACAVMLPITLKTNRAAIEQKAMQLECIADFVAENSNTLNEVAAVDLLQAAVEKLCSALKIPTRLRELGVLREQIPALVAGSKGNSMNGNPREISDHELTEILENNW